MFVNLIAPVKSSVKTMKRKAARTIKPVMKLLQVGSKGFFFKNPPLVEPFRSERSCFASS